MGRVCIATWTVNVISALPQEGRKRVHHYKLKLRAYCFNMYTVFFAGLDPHTSIYLVRTRKKREIETHPPKAARLWYRVGRKTTFFFFFFASKAKGLSNRQVSVQQLKGLFFSSCCLKKGRCRRLRCRRRRLTATAAMAAVSRCEAGVAPPSAQRRGRETEGASGLSIYLWLWQKRDSKKLPYPKEIEMINRLFLVMAMQVLSSYCQAISMNH